MNAVGKLGSFLSAPFHPFGGAVDIIVVEQKDGSLKSSPWYVRFGKFQGVLKSKEKVVSINVNEVDANFNMYLDYKGEAYFLREEEVEEGDLLFSPSSSGEDTDGKLPNRRAMKSKSLNYDSTYPNSVTQIDVGNGNVITRTNSKRSRILRYVFGRKSINGNSFSEGENVPGVVRAESLQRAEIAADLLEVKWSTNLNSNSFEKDNFLQSSAEEALQDDSIKDMKKRDGQRNEDAGMNQNVADNSDGCETHEEACSLSSQKLEISAEETSKEISCLVAEYLVETVTLCGNINKSVSDESIQTEKSGVASVDNIENAENMVSEIGSLELEPCNGNMLKREHLNEEILVEKNHISIEGDKHLESESTSNRFHERVESLSVPTISRANDLLSEVREDITVTKEVDDIKKPGGRSALLNILGSEISAEEQLLFGDLDEFTLGEVRNLELLSRKVEEVDLSLSHRENEGDESSDNFHLEERKSDANDGRRKLKTTSRDIYIGINDKGQPKEVTLRVRSLPNMRSLDNRISNNLGHSLDGSIDSSSDWSRTTLLPPDFISPVKSSADNDGQSTLAQQTNQDSKTTYKLEDRQIDPHGDDLSANVDASNGGSTKVSEPALNSNGSSETGNISKSPSGKDERIDAPKINVVTKKIITLTPTSEQLATLNLKEGRNVVKFTFSTSMLGKQQVDARIYLWRWDTRIVISDVDGTITKSDVLGQFMPMVGVDWSHSGVAHLFSAIKENGYQLIFLSARAVSQAYLTKQFLFNLKQDGKTLPDGPVVISPDGLFPSLFREVVRRAPHEFKIACLEEIKALFPSDWNPFYAGFGNRDTDELSYRKVGIPKGKIFIINTKGEIVVNHQIATKSYPSLHALVNAMFPPTLLFEEEKFNSWNFWKLPPLANKA